MSIAAIAKIAGDIKMIYLISAVFATVVLSFVELVKMVAKDNENRKK